MNKDFFSLTTSQFAKLHNVNKRTLHYYDKIGLFFQKIKGKTIIDIILFYKALILNISACLKN